MNKNLLKILQSFSKEEWKRFEDFLKSPFFVKGRNYSGLISLIRKNIGNEKADEVLTHDYFNRHLKEPISKTSFKSRLSELNNLALKFLHYINAVNDKSAYIAGIFDELDRRNLYSNIHFLNTQSGFKLKPGSLYDYPSYMKVLKAVGSYNIDVNNMDKYHDYFNEYNNHFVAYALFSLITTAYSYNGYEGTKIEENKEWFMKVYSSINFDELVQGVKGNPVYVEVILMHYIVKAMLNWQDESLFLTAFEYFASNYKSFPEIMKELFYLHLQSLCVHGVSNGIEKYYEYYLDTIKHKKANNYPVITNLNRERCSEFHDIVSAALKCGEIEWTEKFIKDYLPLVNPESRELDRVSSLTALNVKRKNFLAARKIMKEFANTDNKFYGLEIRMYGVVVNYELGLDDELEKELHNMRRFIKNHHKLAPPLFDSMNLFVKNAGRLASLKNKPRRKAEEFFNYIKSERVLFPKKDWILEKTEKLL